MGLFMLALDFLQEKCLFPCCIQYWISNLPMTWPSRGKLGAGLLSGQYSKPPPTEGDSGDHDSMVRVSKHNIRGFHASLNSRIWDRSYTSHKLHYEFEFLIWQSNLKLLNSKPAQIWNRGNEPKFAVFICSNRCQVVKYYLGLIQ